VQRFRRALWTVAALVAALWLARAFVGDVYYVDSASMEPTLHGAAAGGDWVFVLYARDPRPRRFDLVVLQREGEADPLVKRVAGLPGESVQIGSGDLFVGGAPLDPREPRPPWIELFDSRRDDLASSFDLEARERWTATADGWRLESRGAGEILAKWRGRLTDGHRRPDGTIEAGKRQVGDARVECAFAIDGRWRRFALRLTEEGDVYELEVAPVGPETLGRARLRLARGTGEKLAFALLAEREVLLAPGERHEIALSNADGSVSVDFDGRPAVLRARSGASTPLDSAPDPVARHRFPRVAIGGEDVALTLHRVRVLRDVHYTELGTHGTQRSETLAPDEVFVLGDNSAASADSREWGPISTASIVGRPVAVVWPPSRWRWLSRPEGASGR
jgi:signal peptidase I